ncbi:restriction endonuclease subunit S [uncultured Alistipes sp.]|uniref:restriction endonuclease subunit S n=1 Tax=uncultured Alistipes sp. TaxID=538949 RepID=UPI00259389F0|nr:restriction endonuclease subunit S [uncultured Alistipes sp.]
MTKYPTYKDSGIEWLGQIPTHWEMLKAKYMFQKNKREVQDGDKVITCFRDGQVTLRENRRTTGFTESITEIGYQGIRKGDLVIHQMDAFAGAIGVSDADGKGTSVYHCCTPKGEYLTYYYAHVIREMALKGYIQSLYRGIRERSSDFNYVTFGNCLLPVPSPSEQRQIVAYLDYKSNKINERICQRERELQTISELKQAEIATVVTRGLVPNVPMKESGIEWLGKIPAHWNVKRIASVSHEINDSNVTMEYTQPSQFKFGEIVLKSIIGEGEYDENIKKCTLFKKNDILINGLNLNYDFVTQRVAKSNYDGIITPAYIVIRVKDGLSADYAMFLFKSIDNKKIFNGWGTGIRLTLSYKELKKQCIPIPPKEEQDAIVAYLQSRITFIDNYIAKLKEEINYLQEYKQRLISDVVTGKVDVRGVEIPNEE